MVKKRGKSVVHDGTRARNLPLRRRMPYPIGPRRRCTILTTTPYHTTDTTTHTTKHIPLPTTTYHIHTNLHQTHHIYTHYILIPHTHQHCIYHTPATFYYRPCGSRHTHQWMAVGRAWKVMRSHSDGLYCNNAFDSRCIFPYKWRPCGGFLRCISHTNSSLQFVYIDGFKHRNRSFLCVESCRSFHGKQKVSQYDILLSFSSKVSSRLNNQLDSRL